MDHSNFLVELWFMPIPIYDIFLQQNDSEYRFLPLTTLVLGYDQKLRPNIFLSVPDILLLMFHAGHHVNLVLLVLLSYGHLWSLGAKCREIWVCRFFLLRHCHLHISKQQVGTHKTCKGDHSIPPFTCSPIPLLTLSHTTELSQKRESFELNVLLPAQIMVLHFGWIYLLCFCFVCLCGLTPLIQVCIDKIMLRVGCIDFCKTHQPTSCL